MAEPDSGTVYVMDASSWILIDGHPAQNQILDRLYQLADEGRLKSPTQVIDEVKKTSDVRDWLVQHRNLIAETPTSDIDFLGLVGRITGDFPAMQGARGTRERGDAWVVALAAHRKSNPEDWIVVADETAAKRPNRKIPTACNAYGVQCKGLMEMLAEEFPDDGC